jgi:DNA-binding NarL/FixJ family response regulator
VNRFPEWIYSIHFSLTFICNSGKSILSREVSICIMSVAMNNTGKGILKPQIIIADNQYLVTESLVMLLRQSNRFNLAGLAASTSELKALLKENPDTRLLIVDYFLLDFHGFDELKSLVSTVADMKTLILTHHVRLSDIKEFDRIGIRNILYKIAGPEEILQAIDTTLGGRKYYSDEALNLLIENRSVRDEGTAPLLLTPSEIDITRLIAHGLTTRQIAEKKHLSSHTVMAHRRNIFRKLAINSISELIMYAIKAGLIDNIEYNI